MEDTIPYESPDCIEARPLQDFARPELEAEFVKVDI